MKTLSLVLLVGFGTIAAAADFFDDHDSLFRNQNLCEESSADQVQAGKNFKEMYSLLKQSEALEEKSSIEVLDYAAYTTNLLDTVTRVECSIVRHDGCYSAYCGQ